MQRYNTFNMIHKALRAMLYDTALTVQQTYFADAQDAHHAFEKINEVIHAFEEHGKHEDLLLMPSISEFDQETIHSFEEEHREDRRMGNTLVHLQNIYNAAGTPDERIAAGSAITVAFRNYLVFNLEHMQREEVELNKLLWDNYTDEELYSINEKIIATISPEEMNAASKWMMRAVNKQEAIQWLTAVKENAPAFVFDSLWAMTDSYLPARTRKEVRDAVSKYTTALVY